ncbi:hypothetical protein LSH36_221g01000 [Paralvinella palmiformis]|uniref:Uncharacterized protein n=1 Tax=Paralvinella palmiformis TaxID=53620 RepID=A0AAD9JN07_9ANNE|nr:hypothetical protein LSH36_221g01000 [Paralvinella palmiformis]
MICSGKSDCKPKYYCDASTWICEPCERICDPRYENLVTCRQFCQEEPKIGLLTTTATTTIQPRPSSSIVIERAVFIGCIVLLLVILLVMAIAIRRKRQQRDNEHNTVCGILGKITGTCFQQSRCAGKIASSSDPGVGNENLPVDDTSVKLVDVDQISMKSNKEWTSLVGNVIVHPTEELEQIADKTPCTNKPPTLFLNLTSDSWIGTRPVSAHNRRVSDSFVDRNRSSLVLQAYNAVESRIDQLPFIRACMLENDGLQIFITDNFQITEAHRKIVDLIPGDIPEQLVHILRISEAS